MQRAENQYPAAWEPESLFLAPESLEKNRSRSRLEKMSGAGAAKKLAGSSVLPEDKSIRKLYIVTLNQ